MTSSNWRDFTTVWDSWSQPGSLSLTAWTVYIYILYLSYYYSILYDDVVGQQILYGYVNMTKCISWPHFCSLCEILMWLTSYLPLAGPYKPVEQNFSI